MPLTKRYRQPAPITVSKEDGNVVVTGPGLGTWLDVDPDGSAASRPRDVVFPGCKAGDYIEVAPNFVVNPGAQPTLFDIFTFVDGVAVHQFGAGAGGTDAWYKGASVTTGVSGGVPYQVQTGDLENAVGGVGSVRTRLRFSRASGSSITITAASGYSWRMAGRGPF